MYVRAASAERAALDPRNALRSCFTAAHGADLAAEKARDVFSADQIIGPLDLLWGATGESLLNQFAK
jgi:hypothetical protein